MNENKKLTSAVLLVEIQTNKKTFGGHFSHIDDVIGVHRGISKAQKEKVLNTFFLLGTIAADEDKSENCSKKHRKMYLMPKYIVV